MTEKPVKFWLVALILTVISSLLHGPSLFLPSQYAFCTADIAGRQPELDGSTEFQPKNRILIDPILQFHVWDRMIQASTQQCWENHWNPMSGGGSPLAGNGQSRVLDPLHRFFLMAPLPWAWVAESFTRFLWTGLGFYFLFATMGLPETVKLWSAAVIPLSGFFILWQQFPLVSSASVIPWVLWTFLNLWKSDQYRWWLGSILSLSLLFVSGNIQIAAVTLCILLPFLMTFGTGIVSESNQTEQHFGQRWSSAGRCLLALTAAVLLTTPSWLATLDYLRQSPILEDRISEHTGDGRGASSRWRDLPCLAFPYLYGSERRGDPNLHKVIGASNVNEAASGYFGFTSLFLLLPVLLFSNDGQNRKATLFFTAVLIVSWAVSYRIEPINWIWPHIPLLSAIDPRRFVVGMPVGGLVLAGLSLDRIRSHGIPQRLSAVLSKILVLIIPLLILAAGTPHVFRDRIEDKARQHYSQSIPPGPDQQKLIQIRVDQQMSAMLSNWPAYLLGRIFLLSLFWFILNLKKLNGQKQSVLLATLALLELFQSGWGYNPHISRKWVNFGENSALIQKLRLIRDAEKSLGHEARFLAIGDLLPPNQLARFGLKDLRNYDSIENLGVLSQLAPVFSGNQSNKDRTSRRDVDWHGIKRASQTLKTFGVIAVIGASPPPVGLFDEVITDINGVWIGRWEGQNRFTSSGLDFDILRDEPGVIHIRINADSNPMIKHALNADSEQNPQNVKTQSGEILIRESWMEGWQIIGMQSAKNEPGDLFRETALDRDPSTNFIRLRTFSSDRPRILQIVFRPKHWRFSLFLSFLGLSILTLGFATTGRSLPKLRSCLFSQNESQG
ncbi:MAG: hypothetical protein RJA81_992 [Planctomycetota bacterium]